MKKTARSNTNRIFYILIAAVAIGGIAALTYASTRPKPDTVTQVDSTLPKIESEGYVMGSPTAPLEVIEFGDFECPQCSNWSTLTEPDVRTRLIGTGRIRLRYIDYPLGMHPNTWNASRAAACADEQGKFWDFHDMLFATQDRWSAAGGNTKPDKFFKNLAKQLALKTDQFDQCVDSRKYQAKIQAHERLAVQRHAGGTPTFIIGNQLISRALTFDEFAKMVEDAVATGTKSVLKIGGDTAQGATLVKPKP